MEIHSHGILPCELFGNEPLGSALDTSTGLVTMAPLPTLDIDDRAPSLAADDLTFVYEESDQTPLMDNEPVLSALPDPLLGKAEIGTWRAAVEKLEQFARSPTSTEALSLAFGVQAQSFEAETVLDQLLSGQQPPQIELLPMAELAAQGAYAADIDTIFLAEELLLQPEQLTRVLLEEMGHFLDNHINPADTPGDEGALFAELVMGNRLTAAEIAALQTEDDTATLAWKGQALQVERADLEPGVFTVEASGQLTVEFIADSGGYESQIAIFSLEGMEGFMPGSANFIRETARRALTNSSEGYLVVDDTVEKASLSGELGEADRNEGKVFGSKAFSFTPGDSVAVMLVPNGSIQDVFDNPTADGSLQPLFSLAAANPNGQTYIGQIRPGLYAMEDLRFDSGSDGDFNDLIFSLQGATGSIESVTNLVDAEEAWLNTPLGQQLFNPTIKQPDAESPDNFNPESPDNPDPQTLDTSTPNPSGNPNAQPPENPQDFQLSIVDRVPKFKGSSSEAQIAASGAARISLGTQTIYIGTNQVSDTNQNPIIASFDSVNSTNNWLRTDYETTGADGRGLGLAWNGNALYGVFSVDGTQGSASEDFRRASADAQQAWLRSYGQGGGAKVSVLGQIDPTTGTLLNAAYLSAVLSSGKSNTLTVTDLDTTANGHLLVSAESFFSPRRPNGTALTQVTSDGSPFAYTVEITSDLKRVISTAAPGWV
ncbi:MAG: DUF4114 domain-containing protein [Leptolyngbyaceae cyanobacterium]